MSIHPSSIISSKAKLGQHVTIGPFCVIGPNVVLGDNVEIKSHVVVEGFTEIGDETIIYPFASIGTAPQDLKYAGEASKVVIGKKNLIREYVTIQPGTTGGGMITSIGDNNLFMIGTHIAHDCKVGNNCIFANNATLAGHVVVGDSAVMGGLCAVRQYVRIGAGAMVGGLAGVEHDVLPYVTIAGERAMIEGVNIVGMRRRGFELKEVQVVQNIIEVLFDKMDGTMYERVASLREQYAGDKAADVILDFVEAQGTKLGYCEPRG
jgi:UDP-N-acetylglucosamine acyltransferase